MRHIGPLHLEIQDVQINAQNHIGANVSNQQNIVSDSNNKNYNELVIEQKSEVGQGKMTAEPLGENQNVVQDVFAESVETMGK